MHPRQKTLLLVYLGLLLAAPPARAAADLALEDARRFLASRPELARLADRPATRLGPGQYRLEPGAPGPQVLVLKQGSGWAAALALDPGALALDALLPPALLGTVTPHGAVVVVGAAAGRLGPGAVPGLGRELAYGPGVTLATELEVGEDGTLGKLRLAGLLPAGPLWLTGSAGAGLAEALLGGGTPDLKALDFSLTLAVDAFSPPPFATLSSPRLTLGEGTFTFTRAGGALTLSGRQVDSRLALGERTFLIPRTTLTFTTAGEGYEVAVEGASSRQGWRDAFGLQGVELESVALRGTVSASRAGPATPPITGFGLGLAARVRVDRASHEGELLVEVEDGALKAFSVALKGDLNLGFLPGGADYTLRQVSLAIAPASQQAALAGALAWRGLDAQALVVLSRQPALLMRVSNLDLGALAGAPVPGLPALPPLDALVTLGLGGAGGEAPLPEPAQALVDAVSGVSGHHLALARGVGLLTRVDAEALGGEAHGLKGPLAMSGALDPAAGTFRLAAAMPKLPPLPGLPKGFGVEAPELFLAVERRGGSAVASSGLGLRLLLPVDGQVLAFRGAVAGSGAGTFSFTGALESDWASPVGLTGLTVLAPVVVTVGVGADASVDLGLQGGLSVGKQRYAPMALCLTLQAAAPAPVPKKVAVRFKGSEFGPRAQLELLEALVKSVASGPLRGGLEDPGARRALAAVAPGVDRLDAAVASLDLPLLSFTQVDVGLTTPGVTCDVPAIQGVGIAVKGTARLLEQELGEVDSAATLAGGLRIDAQVRDVDLLGVVALTGVRLDVLAPMPGSPPPPGTGEKLARLKARLGEREAVLRRTSAALAKARDPEDRADLTGDRDDLQEEVAALRKQLARQGAPDPGHFRLLGKASVLRASADLAVAIDRTQASFEFSSDLADLGAVKLSAESQGADLRTATDFQVHLAASTDLEATLLRRLGTALQATAAARARAGAELKGGDGDARERAQAAFDRLDDSVGRDLRGARRDLRKARAALARARRAVARVKDRCEDELGDAAFLCDGLDAARETLAGARSAVAGAREALRGLEQGADAGRLQAARATLASLQAGQAALEAGLAGWAAVDAVAQLVATGAAGELVTIDEVALEGSLRARRGTLTVTASVGEADLEQALEVDLASPAPLDLQVLADQVADELEAQALKEGSAVWKRLRKGNR